MYVWSACSYLLGEEYEVRKIGTMCVHKHNDVIETGKHQNLGVVEVHLCCEYTLVRLLFMVNSATKKFHKADK